MKRTICLLLAATCSTPGWAETFTGPRIQAVMTLDNLRFDLADVNGNRAASSVQRWTVGYDMAIAPSLVAGGEVEVDQTGIAGNQPGMGFRAAPGGR